MDSPIQTAPRRSRALRLAAAGVAAAVAVALLAGRGPVRTAIASDHQDTPETELSPRMDINDVYAFPGATPDRIALVLTTSSPITPGQAAANPAFDPNLLYQIKVDNTGDAMEDFVFQLTFTGTGASQQVKLTGPVKPNAVGTMNTLVTTGPTVTGAINATLGTATGTQLFAGLRGDPFFIDLEQFFRILPDRRPAGGPLALTAANSVGVANWRTPGVDFLKGFSTLAVVIELPVAQLTAGGTSKIGVWGTISR